MVKEKKVKKVEAVKGRLLQRPTHLQLLKRMKKPMKLLIHLMMKPDLILSKQKNALKNYEKFIMKPLSLIKKATCP